MRTLWPPVHAPSAQDGGDSIEAVGAAAQDPGPLLTGPNAALWVGFSAFIIIFLIVLMMLIRGRVIAPARRRAMDARFFEPAGVDADITFDAPERNEPADKRKKKAKKKRHNRKAPAPEFSGGRDVGDLDDPRAAPADDDVPAKPKKSGAPFAGLFKKKKPAEPPPSRQARDDERAEVEIEPAREDAQETIRPAYDETPEDFFGGEVHGDRAAAEEDERRGLDDDARSEDGVRGHIHTEARRDDAREAEFERRRAEAALEQRMQSLTAMQRRRTERGDGPRDDADATQSRPGAFLESRFAALADQLSARIESAAAAGGRRAHDDDAGFSNKIAAEFADALSREFTSLRKSTEDAVDKLSRRIDAMNAASPEGAAGLAQEIAGLNALLSGKAAAATAGRVQLTDLVRSVLPAERYVFAKTLSTGRTADCLIYAPNVARPIAVDARFPVEAFDEYMRDRANPDREARARDEYRRAALRHIVDIAEHLIAPGETADFAVMFAPSESIFNDLHSEFGDVVQDSYRARVWILSPTSLMACLHMMSALAGGGPEQGGEAALIGEIDALRARVAALESAAPGQAAQDHPSADETGEHRAPAPDADDATGDLFETTAEAFERLRREEALAEARRRRDPYAGGRPTFPLRSQERD